MQQQIMVGLPYAMISVHTNNDGLHDITQSSVFYGILSWYMSAKLGGYHLRDRDPWNYFFLVFYHTIVASSHPLCKRSNKNVFIMRAHEEKYIQ